MNKIEAVLECGDSVKLSIDSNALDGSVDAYCRFHGYKPVVEKFPSEWRVICIYCNFGRWCGQHESAAKRIASRHKHNCLYGIDTVTKSGGTAKKQLAKKWLRELREAESPSTLIENEPPPF